MCGGEKRPSYMTAGLRKLFPCLAVWMGPETTMSEVSDPVRNNIFCSKKVHFSIHTLTQNGEDDFRMSFINIHKIPAEFGWCRLALWMLLLITMILHFWSMAVVSSVAVRWWCSIIIQSRSIQKSICRRLCSSIINTLAVPRQAHGTGADSAIASVARHLHMERHLQHGRMGSREGKSGENLFTLFSYTRVAPMG